MKKALLIISTVVSLIVLSGCSSNPKDEVPENVFVTFKDYDDSVLYHTRIPYGTKASYVGINPSRNPTNDKVYTFIGWDKNLDLNLYDNTIFNAVYRIEPRQYLVTFYNYNDTELWHTNAEYGSYVTYDSDTPTKTSDDEHFSYDFDGWDKDLETYQITCDTSFKAVFKTTEYVFVTFQNYNEEVLENKKIIKGESVAYTGRAPVRNYDGFDKGYKFIGWDGDLTYVNNDTVFTAQFDLLNLYQVTFENYDGTVIKTITVYEGDDATYYGLTPTKPSYTQGDYIYSFTFSGWSSSLDNITCDTVVIAQFDTKVKATGQTGIKQHLDNNGSGTYHDVSTGEGSTLGYLGSYYYVSYSNDDGDISSAIAINFGYGDSYGFATFVIYQGYSKTYEASMKAYVSSHRYSKLELLKLKVCKYQTEQELSIVAALSILAAQYAIDRATNYLVNNDLSYIW